MIARSMIPSFSDILAGRARDQPDATAFDFEGEQRVTYAELDGEPGRSRPRSPTPGASRPARLPARS